MQPRIDGAIWNFAMISPTEDGSSFGDGVAEIEGGDCVEDEFEWVRSVFAGFFRESVEAFGALVDLERSETVATFAPLCRRRAATLRTRRILLLVLCGRHS